MTEPIEFVEDKAKQKWRQSHTRVIRKSIRRILGATSPPDVIYICEYIKGDFERARCTGKPRSIWRYDGTDFESINRLPKLDTSSTTASRTPLLSYCLNDSKDRLIFQLWQGGLAGYGMTMTLEDGKWCSDGVRWKS